MLNLNATITERTEPFQLFQAQGVLDPVLLPSLVDTAPTAAAQRIAVDDPEHEKQYRMNLFRLAEGDQREASTANLAQPWAELLDDLLSPAYTAWLQERTGIELVGLLRSVGVYAHRNGDFLAVHKDKPTKAITSILYLNPEWPAEAGGRFLMFESNDPTASPVDELAPQGGQLVAFPPTDHSWHAVSTIKHPDEVERLTVQVEYWLSTELMGTTYKGTR